MFEVMHKQMWKPKITVKCPRIDCQAAIVDATKVIHTLYTLAYKITSKLRTTDHQNLVEAMGKRYSTIVRFKFLRFLLDVFVSQS